LEPPRIQKSAETLYWQAIRAAEKEQITG